MADAELGAIVYQNFCEMWRAVGSFGTDRTVFEVEDRADMLLIRSHLSQRVPHMVLDPRVEPGDEYLWTRSLIQLWAGEPVSVMVQLPPGSEDGALAASLHEQGFARGIRPSLAMTRRANPSFEHLCYDDIEQATSGDALEEARQVMGRVFSLPSNVFAFYTPAPVVRTYVLRERGIAVAAACLCPFAGAAGVYSVGVLPDARGKGYARRLVLHILSQAAELGLTTAVLSCEQHLARLYRRLGFTTCCELTTYWMESLWH